MNFTMLMLLLMLLLVIQLRHLTYDTSGVGVSEVAVELYHIRYLPTASDDDRDLETVVSDAVEEDVEDEDERPAPAAEAVRIHEATLSPQYIRFSLTNLGGLTVKDDRMCWSAVDRVLCGRLTSSGSVRDVKTVLQHGVVNGSICHGTYSLTLCNGYSYDWTAIRRPFDCLSKVITVTVT